MSIFEDLWMQLKEAAKRTVRADKELSLQEARSIVEETLWKLRIEDMAADARDYFARSLLDLVEDERKSRGGGQNPT